MAHEETTEIAFALYSGFAEKSLRDMDAQTVTMSIAVPRPDDSSTQE